MVEIAFNPSPVYRLITAECGEGSFLSHDLLHILSKQIGREFMYSILTKIPFSTNNFSLLAADDCRK